MVRHTPSAGFSSFGMLFGVCGTECSRMAPCGIQSIVTHSCGYFGNHLLADQWCLPNGILPALGPELFIYWTSGQESLRFSALRDHPLDKTPNPRRVEV